jgi:4-amino-4-deoxy-L-arabinose transferase-like glycosyltransferase
VDAIAAREQGEARARRPAVAAAWIACVLGIYGAIAATGMVMRDADSFLYESIAATLSRAPVAEWVAPEWPSQCKESGRVIPCFKQGVFVEHLAGLFWPAAVLHRLGFSRGAALANLLYFLVGLRLLFAVARSLAGREVAWAAVFAYALSPLGLQYLLRANHEPAWNVAFLGALAALTSVRGRRARAGLFALAAAGAFLAKGVLGLFLFPVLGLWVLYRDRSLRELPTFAAGLAAVALAAAGYQAWFRAATGGDFYGSYFGAQLHYMKHAEEVLSWHRFGHPAYYAASLAWFALPSSIGAALALARARGHAARPSRGLLVAVGAFVAVCSLMSRRAVRYIFPAYALVHPAGMEELLARFPRARAFLARHDRALHFALAGLLLAVAAARIALGSPRRVNLLPGV